MFEILAPEPAARDELERARPLIEQLDVAHVGGGDGDGGVHDLQQERGRVAILGQPGAHLLESFHADQVGGQPRLALAQRLFS